MRQSPFIDRDSGEILYYLIQVLHAVTW